MDSKNKPLYAIRQVEEMTGIKPVTLRAWQRRYGLIQPQRTEKGHRLFSESDVEQIRLIQSWLAKGVSIGKVALIINSEEFEETQTESDSFELEECAELRIALADLNQSRCLSVISIVMKEYPLPIVEERFIRPILESLMWVKMPLKSLQLGLFQSLLTTKLAGLLQIENKASRKGKCLCISLDSIGSIFAWLWACTKSAEGYNVTFLEGVDELSGLIDHQAVRQYQTVDIFANKALTELQLAAVRRLRQENSPLQLSGLIETLHDEAELQL